MKDPYKVLGIPTNASEAQIKEAYRELAKKYHPDKYQDNPLSELAEEKFQEVNEAYDMLMNRVVAIKMLKNEIANDEESVKRFINESKAVAMMSHPNIVSIYDVNVREDIKYIAMEYVNGITLKEYIERKQIGPTTL